MLLHFLFSTAVKEVERQIKSIFKNGLQADPLKHGITVVLLVAELSTVRNKHYILCQPFVQLTNNLIVYKNQKYPGQC